MEKFAGYGFNKSHSAAYALVAYQTAYLKTHYPVEFMAALLTSETSKPENVVKYIGECKEMGIAWSRRTCRFPGRSLRRMGRRSALAWRR
jgi:DNA polymerase-3 subunit alpha